MTRPAWIRWSCPAIRLIFSAKLKGMDVLPLITPVGYEYLAAAYKLDGEKFSADQIRGALDSFRAKLTFEEAGAIAVATNYGDDCDWVFKNAFKGEGGLDDSAGESARFLENVWNELKTKKNFSVVRSSGFKYAIARDGKKIYESKSEM